MEIAEKIFAMPRENHWTRSPPTMPPMIMILARLTIAPPDMKSSMINYRPVRNAAIAKFAMAKARVALATV